MKFFQIAFILLVWVGLSFLTVFAVEVFTTLAFEGDVWRYQLADEATELRCKCLQDGGDAGKCWEAATNLIEWKRTTVEDLMERQCYVKESSKI